MRNFLFNILAFMLMKVCRHPEPIVMRGLDKKERTFCPNCGKMLENNNVR
jgi:hypothetical protein